jgi:phage tail-like protein
MALQRQTPYAQFNFSVDLSLPEAGPSTPLGGFQECSALAQEVAVIEYRYGNDPNLRVQKLTGLNKVTDVTLKRGVVGTTTLFGWFDQIRRGNVDPTSNYVYNITITLNTEVDQTTPVLSWTLVNARPIKHSIGPLNAKGTDVAMEELTIAYEQLSVA